MRDEAALRSDTICAVATAHGGAIGVIRVSGPDAIAIADTIFLPAAISPDDKRKGTGDERLRNDTAGGGRDGGGDMAVASSRPLLSTPSHTIRYGRVMDGGDVVDDVLVSVFRAPHSYTGEDSVEISFHDSSYIAGAIMRLLTDGGCRAAMPGEYTMRAFLNGKMDLSRAEAVADLIASTNRATHKIAMSQLRGAVSSELTALRKQLLDLCALLELELDFSDQDVTFADRQQLRGLAVQVGERIDSLIRSFATGRAVKEGIAVTIAGKANVGKSTLLNALAGEERAIVSSSPGTTRDAVDACIDIRGVTFRLTDTAGLRQTTDSIERMGVDIALKKIGAAMIVLYVTDGCPTDVEAEEMMSKCADKRVILVMNKIDLHDCHESGGRLTDSDGGRSISGDRQPTDGGGQSTDSGDRQPTDSSDRRSTDSGDKRSTEGNGASQDRTASLPPCLRSLPHIGISAKNGTNIDQLKQMIYDAAGLDALLQDNVIISSARHYDALRRARKDINDVINAINDALPADLVAEHLRCCVACLGEIVGEEISPDETLTHIFSHFCIGK